MQHPDAVRSRLSLWYQAVCESRQLLVLAERAKTALTSEDVRAKDERDSVDSHNYLMTETDYVPGQGLKSSYFSAYRAKRPREFGDSLDLWSIAEACHMLAVILFCQIFKLGNGDPGIVAKNDKDFVETHIDALLQIITTSEDERQKFMLLRAKLEKARDKMLGHADGKSFEFKRHAWGEENKLHVTAIQEIDFEEFSAWAFAFETALFAYRNPSRD